MKKFVSDKVLINSSGENIFVFLCDFNNFEKLMPEQVINWKSTENTCSFTIKGLTDISMKIHETIPHTAIIIVPKGKAPFEFELLCNIESIEDNKAEAHIIFNADLNPMLSMMASKPLQNFVNMLIYKLQELF